MMNGAFTNIIFAAAILYVIASILLIYAIAKIEKSIEDRYTYTPYEKFLERDGKHYQNHTREE